MFINQLMVPRDTTLYRQAEPLEIETGRSDNHQVMTQQQPSAADDALGDEHR